MAQRPPLLSLRVAVSGSVAVVELAGECDMSEAQQLAATLRDAGERASEVQVDLSRLEFLDSSALQVLHRVSAELAARRSRLVLVAPTPAIARVLHIARLEDLFEIRDRGEDFARHANGSSPLEPDSHNGSGAPAPQAYSAQQEGAGGMTADDTMGRQIG